MSQLVAQKAADELAARMGVGWVTRVWENLGWHYRVLLVFGEGANAEINEYRNAGDDSYSYDARINLGMAAGASASEKDRDDRFLRASMCYFGKGDTPQAALKKAYGCMLREEGRIYTAFRQAHAFLDGRVREPAEAVDVTASGGS